MNESSERKKIVPKLAKGMVLGMALGLLLAEMSENRILGYFIGMTSGIAMGMGFGNIETTKPKKFSELSDSEKRTRVALLAFALISLKESLPRSYKCQIFSI